jgi:arylsulfatase A-like enzyme
MPQSTTKITLINKSEKNMCKLTLLMTVLLCQTIAVADKPNILFIFSDDQRADTIHALGNKDIITPNLDKLSDQSMVFLNGYCYGAHTEAVCIASRNQLQTGNVWHRWAPAKWCSADGETMPKVMKAAGYETFYREKSGSANHPQILKQYDHFKDIHNVRALMSGRACKPFVDDALKFLKEDRDPSKPFFIFLGVSGPHDPRFSEKRFRDLYDINKMPLPKNFKGLHHWDIGSMTVRDEKLEEWPRTKKAVQSHILDYYALITAMDYDLGRLLDFVEKDPELSNNTIIIYSSDHGLGLGSHGLMGKQNTYETGMRVSLFIAGPGIKAGKTDAFVYLHDIFPTVADFGGGEITEKIDGKSLRAIIEGKAEKVRDVVTLAYRDTQRTIRTNRWKLMVFPQINKYQLFDLKNDPDEITDVASDNPEVVQELMKRLKSELNKNGDKQTLRVDEPKRAKFDIPKVKVHPRHLVGGESKTQTTD